MKPSLWTSLYHQMSPTEALRVMAAQGWESFELSCEHIGMLGQGGAAAVAEYARVRDELGVTINQCHCTITVDVASPDDQRRASDVAQVHTDLDICADLGIRNVVIHPGGYGEFTTARQVQAVDELRRASFAELAAHAERVGVRLALENMTDYGKGVWGHRRFGALAEDLIAFISDLGAPALGVCWDTSHANIMGLNQPEAIRTCGDLLIALHCSDNDGSGDQHRTPGYGNVDWPGIVVALREINYPWDFNLEIPGELRVEHPAREIVDLRSVYAFNLCRYLLR